MTAGVSFCPGCGSHLVARHLDVAEMMFGLDETFVYCDCAQCGTLRLLDVPQDFEPYYPNTYYSVGVDPEQVFGGLPARALASMASRSVLFGRGIAARGAAAVLRKRQFQSFVSQLGSVRLAGLPRGRHTSVLDIGCGSGVLIYALGLAGMKDVTGVDPFAASDRTFDTGARLLRRQLIDIDGTFDLIMFHHSFEHVLDPGETLRQARRLLSPGGRILVRMPTTSSEAFSRYKEQWIQLDPPRHVTVFSREGMAELCAQQGMKIESTYDDSTSFQFWGSEQAARGLALVDPASHMVDETASAFSRKQIAQWARAARRLNERGRGDQSAWVIAADRAVLSDDEDTSKPTS